MSKQPPKSKLEEMLGTANRAEQEALVEELIKQAQAPATTIVITFDPTAETPVHYRYFATNGPALVETMQMMLGMVQQALIREEVVLRVKKAQQESTGEQASGGAGISPEAPADPSAPPPEEPAP